MNFYEYAKDNNCLIIFYPQNHKIATLFELATLQPLIPEFKKAKCKIIAISTDDVQSNMDWQKDNGFTLPGAPLLSDKNGAVARMYRMFNETDKNCFPASTVCSGP